MKAEESQLVLHEVLQVRIPRLHISVALDEVEHQLKRLGAPVQKQLASIVAFQHGRVAFKELRQFATFMLA